jgi:hypothetical protein
MTKSASGESLTRSLETPSIHPTLQAALSSLDVNLEDELVRYRRQRAGRPTMANRDFGRQPARHSIELMALNQGEKAAPPPIPLGRAEAEELLASAQARVNQTPETETSPKTIEPSLPSNQAHSHSSLNLPELDNTVVKTESTEPLTSPPEQENLGGELVYPSATPEQPEDYLESSEELLRSLAEEEAASRPQSSFIDNLLTPLGVGSMLLLLLSSATLGYILLDPSNLSYLGFNRGSNSETASEATGSSVPIEGPNLASEEFVDLNLNNLSSLEASPSTPPLQNNSTLTSPPATSLAPSQAPGAATTGPSDSLTSVLLPPSLQPQLAPPVAVPSVIPVPNPGAAPPRQAINPSPVQPQQTAPAPPPESSIVPESPPEPGDKLYYVLVNYSGVPSLQQARTVVPDAYVRNFSGGTKIQMGAFLRESEAQTLVNQLKQQGVSATIRRP